MRPALDFDFGDSTASPGWFRPAVLAGREALSRQAREEIRALAGPRPVRFVRELVLNWLVVALTIAAGLYFHHPAVTLVCIVVVATRQMVLGLLLHEQVHGLGIGGRYGDWLANMTVAYPLFVTTVEDYTKVHLSHHKYFFTERDPDFLRKAGPDWTFPMHWTRFLRIVARDVSGLNTLALVRGKTAPTGLREFDRRNPSPPWLRPAYYATLAVALTVFGAWTPFLLYWVLPTLTVTQLLVRWIAVLEHRYNVPGGSVRETTPLVRLKLWQRVLIPDLNFAMHVYHHTHPAVSFSQLPAVHEVYRREGLVDDSAVFDGAGAYLAYLVSKQD